MKVTVGARRLPVTAAAGDFIVLLLFPVLGAASHGLALTPGLFARTTVTFAVAWIVVGLLAKVFTPSLIGSPRRTLNVIPLAWLLAGILGNGVRDLVFDRSFALGFELVSIGVIGVMLFSWRLALAAVQR